MNDVPPLEERRPTTLAGLKRLAKQFVKQKGIQHARALDLAAKSAGYQNYPHAQRHMS